MKSVLSIVIVCVSLTGMQTGAAQPGKAASACGNLLEARDLTLLSAAIRQTPGGVSYCYVRGLIYPAIHYHAQLPLPENWNGRFLMWGDGGKDGDLDFADERLEQGYAVANSNTGHDNGTEPGSSFGFNNRQSEIDFGYRAVHLTTLAGKSLVNAYYRKAPEYAYFEGCSTGGRQALMEAQRYPYDFNGIVAGAPVNYYQAMNAAGVWNMQRLFRDNMAGNLAVDVDGNGSHESLRLVDILAERVLARCDAGDGVRDGIVSDPFSCDFKPDRDLADLKCPASGSTDQCFTNAQIQTINDFYTGAYDSQGTVIYPGRMIGSESDWTRFIPHAGNNDAPGMLVGPAGDHVNYLFYENDPGVTIPDLSDVNYQPKRSGGQAEFHWMDFSVDDFTAGKAALMSSIMDATDPDLGNFLLKNHGKLIIYHGLGDALSVAAATVNYYQDMVDETFAGSMATAQDNARLFLAPGMGHCGGGPGPNNWDKLTDLVNWVEHGMSPDAIVATHASRGSVDNERPLCAFPEQARYVGPANGADIPANWKATNFRCE